MPAPLGGARCKATRNRIQLRGGLAGIGVALTSVLMTSPAFAQASASAGPQELTEIIVTAQKRSERLQDVPISVSVLGGAQLDGSTVKGVSEALTSVPGIAFSESIHAGGGLVTVRGVSAPQAVFGGSSPVAYYLDSVPFGLVQSAITPDANVYDLDRVEALRGPQGTLYGASALSGVVRVLTKDPVFDDFDLKFRVAGSSTESGDDNFRGDLAVNVPIINDKLAVRAVVDYQDLGGWIDTPLAKNANDTVVRSYRLKVGAKPIEDLTIVGSVWLSREKSGGASAGGTYNTHNVLVDEPRSSDFDAYSLKLVYDLPAASVTSNTSYLKFDASGISDAYYPFGVHVPVEFGFDAKVFSEELLVTSKDEGPWRWTVGAFYRDARDSDLASIPAFLTHLDWTNKSRSYAVFGEVTRLFADDKFGLTVGGRYFHDAVTSLEGKDVAPINPPNYYEVKETYSAATPRVVLTWRPARTLSAYASYSQGFRSGSPQSYYTVSGIEGLFPGVKPDKLYNYEIGLKRDTRAFSFDAAIYYTKWNDIQQGITVPVGNPPIQVAAVTNGGPASGFGIDVGVTVRPIEGLDFGGTVSLNDLSNDSNVMSGGQLLFAKGDRLNFSPKYNAGLFANYSRDLGNGFKGLFSMSGNYTDQQCARISSALAVACGKGVLTTRASLALAADKGWKLTLYGDNLNNFKGVVVGDPFFGPEFARRTRPRTIGLQFDYQF